MVRRRDATAGGGALSSAARLHETRLVGRDHGLRAVAQAELAEHASGVGLDRLVDEHEAIGDLEVREAALALLSLGIAAILRSTAGAITFVLSLLFVPLTAASLLPESAGDSVLRAAPMTAGLAVQRTVDRADSVPIGEWAGLGMVWLWAAAALILVVWLIGRRDVSSP
jgi:hypothetical protein